MAKSLPSCAIFDVDGVMTDGTFLYSVLGKEFKIFGAHDNDGIKLIQSHVKVIFVTADERGFAITRKRIVDDMGQSLFLVNEHHRFEYLNDHFDLSTSIYMGDGFYDAKILRHSLFGIAPQNAREEAKKAAQYITPSRSGEGAILDASLKILERFFPEAMEKLQQYL